MTLAWVKQGVLMYFVVAQMQVMEMNRPKVLMNYLKKTQRPRCSRCTAGYLRYGSHVEKGASSLPGTSILAPTLGLGPWSILERRLARAQIRKHVHLSGGVGIGGVLEPPQATPVS